MPPLPHKSRGCGFRSVMRVANAARHNIQTGRTAFRPCREALQQGRSVTRRPADVEKRDIPPFTRYYCFRARHTSQFSGTTTNFHTAGAKDTCVIFSSSCVNNGVTNCTRTQMHAQNNRRAQAWRYVNIISRFVI
jgi:urease accessory protein UreF